LTAFVRVLGKKIWINDIENEGKRWIWLRNGTRDGIFRTVEEKRGEELRNAKDATGVADRHVVVVVKNK
jgi:hypothetical protein